MVWSPSRKPGGYFRGTIACLSALFHAGRHQQLLALLDKAPDSMWHYRQWGVRALAAMGRKAEAIRYAEASRGLNDNPIAIARACEEILLSSGLADEADARYAMEANQGTTFLASFRAIAKKYPTKAPAKILDDLVASTPGQEGITAPTRARRCCVRVLLGRFTAFVHRAWHDRSTQFGVGGEHAVEADQAQAWLRHQGGAPINPVGRPSSSGL